MKSIIYAISGAMILSASSAHATFIGAANGDLYDYNISTNSSTLIGNTGIMFDIALSTSNILYGVTSGSQLYSIDQTTAARTLIGNTGASVNGLTFASNGILYGSGGNGLYSIDTTTGNASLIGTGSYNSSGDISFDDLGNLYLSSTTGGNGDSLWSLNTADGSGTLIGSTGYSSVYGLNYFNNTLYGFTYSGATLSLDTTTGTGTFVSQNNINTNGADGGGAVVNVPEPSSILLFGLSLVGLSFYRKKPKV